jgi:uncharacterized membrane protein YhhN
MHRPQSRQELEQAVQSVLWWPSALTFLVLGITYSLISEPLTIGPPWFLLVVVLVASIIIYALRWEGLHAYRRPVT